MRHCARVAMEITVGASAHVQAAKQLSVHHVIHSRRNNHKTRPVFRALDVLASKCRHACTSNHPEDHGIVSLRMSKPQDHGRFLFDTHQLFKQQLAPWSVTCEVSTSGLY